MIPQTRKDHRRLQNEKTFTCTALYWLGFVNLVFLTISLVLVITGTLNHVSFNGNSVFGGRINAPAALPISFGFLLTLTALFGIISVCYRNSVLLCAYICFLSTLILIELPLGIIGFMVKSRVLKMITDSLRSAESKYTTDIFVASIWDTLQRELKCCGINRHSEWLYYLNGSSLPDSCCVVYSLSCGNFAIATGGFYKSGCTNAIAQWADKHEAAMAVLFTVIIVIQLLSLILSRTYNRSIR